MFNISIKKINYFLVLLFFLKEVFDGVLRYYLQSLGLTYLVYLPTLLVVFFSLLYILKSVDVRVNKYFFLEFNVLVIWSLIGLLNNNFQQVLFGLYIFSPFFLGQISYWVFNIQSRKFVHFLVFIVGISFLGVVIDLVHDLPWSGFVYSIGDINIEGNRAWSALGINRISGFTRSSFSLACIFITSLILLYGKVSRGVYFFLWLISGIGIFATTTKGIVLVFVVFSVLILIKSFSNFIYKYSLYSIVYGSFLVGVFLPLSAIFVDYSFGFDSVMMKFILMSFEIRLSDTWPDAFNLLDGSISFLGGEGIGSIGTAAMLFDNNNYSPGDNMFVYLYIVFGLTSFFLLTWIVVKFARTIVWYIKEQESLFYSFILILLYGIFSNIIENAVLGFLFGAIIGYIFRKNSNVLVETYK
jgi:hypothetical protein